MFSYQTVNMCCAQNCAPNEYRARFNTRNFGNCLIPGYQVSANTQNRFLSVGFTSQFQPFLHAVGRTRHTVSCLVRVFFSVHFVISFIVAAAFET